MPLKHCSRFPAQKATACTSASSDTLFCSKSTLFNLFLIRRHHNGPVRLMHEQVFNQLGTLRVKLQILFGNCFTRSAVQQNKLLNLLAFCNLSGIQPHPCCDPPELLLRQLLQGIRLHPAHNLQQLLSPVQHGRCLTSGPGS